MSILSAVPFIGPVLEGGLGLLKGKQVASEEADKAEAEERRDGWKDEYALLIISLPFIASFIPGAQDYIRAGFETLKASTPVWYQELFYYAIVAALGLHGLKRVFNR